MHIRLPDDPIVYEVVHHDCGECRRDCPHCIVQSPLGRRLRVAKTDCIPTSEPFLVPGVEFVYILALRRFVQ
jgi:hypothetical protein